MILKLIRNDLRYAFLFGAITGAHKRAKGALIAFPAW
jgi:hypothetical protein